MSLKFRLAFLYSLSVFLILLLSSFSIFIFNENFRKEEFIKRLSLQGSESAELFFSASPPIKSIIDDLDQNAENSSHDEKIFIFDSSYHLLYSTHRTSAPSISIDFFNLANKNKEYIFTKNESEYVLLSKKQQQNQFYVLASGYDTYGHRKSENLKELLTFSVIGGLLLSGFLSFFYVRHAMQPLEELKNQIEKIDEKNLKKRITVGNNNNEIWQIAEKFNAMLSRLEDAFEQRKSFVQHASHELRTPLANMLLQTEAALNKQLPAKDLRNILLSLKEDQQEMVSLTNSLLTLSHYENINLNGDWHTIRIDEIIYEAVDFSNQMWPEASMLVEFETMPENEKLLEFKGNESLLRSAIQNLIENAISYSANQSVKVSILAKKNGITLHFDNTGKPLTQQEQNRLFIPFFRGENAGNKKGYGLGLSIVHRIIEVHNSSINYCALDNNINRFTVFFPHT